MRALAPWTAMTTFRREMDRFFDRLLEPRWDEFDMAGEWWPKVDFSETKDALVVKADLPGVDEKDVSVSLQDQMLTVKGEKRHEQDEKDEQFHRIERAHGAFSRTFRLPTPVESANVTATFKDGVLTVTLPKAPAVKGTIIPIKAA